MSAVNEYQALALECLEWAVAEPDPEWRQDHLHWAAAFNRLARLTERWQRHPLTAPDDAGWQEADQGP